MWLQRLCEQWDHTLNRKCEGAGCSGQVGKDLKNSVSDNLSLKCLLETVRVPLSPEPKVKTQEINVQEAPEISKGLWPKFSRQSICLAYIKPRLDSIPRTQ